MELVKHNGPVSIVGGGAQSSFSIAMNAKAFRVLSDNMYQDKIGSIVREISCNALDSHVMAGTPEKPFLIHMPDAFEPWFTVRDFGTGLSPDAVTQVFTVYFESTKDQSNDAVGAFGLGAKTPFAYTDQFNVTSVLNGTMYSYAAFISDAGIPQINLMDASPTDEPNGVEIKIGVKPADFRAFSTAVKTQLRFFPVKPTIENVIGVFTFDQEGEALFESKNIKIFKAQAYGRANVHIIQGPVGYPMDYSQVSTHLSAEDQAFLRMVQEVGGNFFFNIGEIGVTASREGIEYNAHTINSLKAKIAVAHTELVAWITGQMTALKTPYEKAMFVNDNTTFRSILNGLKIDLTPAVRTSTGTYNFNIGTCPAFKTEIEFKNNVSGQMEKRTVNGISITEYSKNGMSGFTGSRNTSTDAAIHPRKGAKIAIVIRDTNKTPVAKMRHYFKENNLERMYSLVPTQDGYKFDKAFIKALTDHLGGFDIICLASALPDPPKAAYDRTRTDYTRPTAYLARANGSDDLDSVANWTRVYDKLDALTDIDENEVEEAVYITVDRQRTESGMYDVKRIYNDLCRAGVVDLPLFGIRVNDEDKLADSDIKWIKLADYVAEKKAEVIANPNIKRYSIANAVTSVITSSLGTRFDKLQGLDGRTTLGRLLRVRAKAQAIAAKTTINEHMLRIAGYDAEKHPAVTVARNMSGAVFNKTPMVRYISRSGWGAIEGDEAKHIVEYVNHFDGK